jgi:hypothetical protein
MRLRSKGRNYNVHGINEWKIFNDWAKGGQSTTFVASQHFANGKKKFNIF